MTNKRKLLSLLRELVSIPGLSGHEDRVRRSISNHLSKLGIGTSTDMLGNLVAKIEGDQGGPKVMVIAHMDQLGFVVQRIEDSGLIQVTRLGGIPLKALPSQAVLLCPDNEPDINGVIYNKSHHATSPDEKNVVNPIESLRIDAGFKSRVDVEKSGIKIGTPVVYRPNLLQLANDRVAGTSIDDRAGCAVLLELAEQLAEQKFIPTVFLVFSVQEEFNLRGAVVAAQNILPDIAIQIDLMLATDTPEMENVGSLVLGGGPAISLYSFHGRGTLNGVIPHPAIVTHVQNIAQKKKIPLQRTAGIGLLTDLSYVQHVGKGVASVDLGFPMRYSHSSLEVCDLNDLVTLTRLLTETLVGIDRNFNLLRDGNGK